MTFCKYETNEYKAVLTDDTIILKGVLCLWILGSP